ncbi:MAG TPA: hypothetical protein VME40_07755, partial [Caulobacteraceae bacterium]|nr:hypothetical protein [Caulobacteraceae bacterium]
TVLALLLAAAPAGAQPTTPTTKILAIGAIAPGADMKQVRAILPTEVKATVDLYLEGKIDQWYSLEGRNGVAFILNMTDLQAAHDVLEKLPLGQARLMTFELIPIGPLNPLRQLRAADAGR